MGGDAIRTWEGMGIMTVSGLIDSHVEPPGLTLSKSPAKPPADRIPALETVPSSLAKASLRYSYTPKYATDLDKCEIRRKKMSMNIPVRQPPTLGVSAKPEAPFTTPRVAQHPGSAMIPMVQVS